ncbi:co-chaperone DjlA [Pseudomonadota bacterium]
MFKIIGAIVGAIIWGFWGFILGIFVGHQVDKRMPFLLAKLLKNVLMKHHAKVQQAFFEATFSVMGCIAKADGRVSEQEIAMAREVMNRMGLDEAARQQAVEYFNQGKSADFNIDLALQKLRSATVGRRNLVQMFIEIQLGAGYADGSLEENERKLLIKICTELGLSEADFERLDAMIKAQIHSHQPGRTGGMSMEDAYAILDIDASATDAEVKKSYRRLTSQHHPDKLAAKGLPPEMMKLADEKTHEIRTAYERIREERGFR